MTSKALLCGDRMKVGTMLTARSAVLCILLVIHSVVEDIGLMAVVVIQLEVHSVQTLDVGLVAPKGRAEVILLYQLIE